MRSFSRSTQSSGVLLLRRPDERRGRLGRLSNVRWSLLLIALALSVVGAATVHSATSELGVGYLSRQATWVGIGLAALLLVVSVDYQRLCSLAPILYGLSLASLVAVLLVGAVRGGARGWFALGPFAFQPSELAKLATALLLANYLSDVAGEYLTFRQLAIATAIVAAPVGLIAVQPDLGGAAMFAPMLAGALLVAGVRPKVLVTGAILAGVLGLGVWTFGMQQYQRERIATFLQPESDPRGAGYQLRQSKIAVGSGQLLGKGYQQGTQSQLRFLPARHTDFIFSVLAEEWGFLGVALVMALYAGFLFGAAEVASRSRDRLGILVVMTLLAVLGFHVVYNTAMVIGLVPVTGIPLPFLSYGGSFTLFCFAATGLILNVDFRRYVNR